MREQIEELHPINSQAN